MEKSLTDGSATTVKVQAKSLKQMCGLRRQRKNQKRKKINVTIPAGVDDGQQLRLSGQGEPGINGGPAGDLFVVFHVRAHEFFERDGDDIYCEMPLTFAQAALGDEVEVPTLHGKVKLKIPAGTQTGTKFRLRGKGVQNVRGYGQGDQHIVVRVVTPTNLTDKQKTLSANLPKSAETCLTNRK